MLDAQLDRRLEVAELVAAVVAAALEFVREHLFVVEQARDAVGELDLAACAGGHGAQVMEDARRENVASDHAELESVVPGLGFSTMREMRLTRPFGASVSTMP